MRTYTNIDQFIDSLNDSDARLYQMYYTFAIRAGKSEYEAKIDSAESVFNAIKMSRDKSILKY